MVRMLDPGLDLDGFFARVRAMPRRALLLDYDGTLAPFRLQRDQTVPYPGVRAALAAILATRATRLVVISGRAVQDLRPLVDLDPCPELWGSHGWERRWPNSRVELADPGEPAARGLREAAAWADRAGLAARCEPKPASLALHWRGLAPEVVAALHEQVAGAWQPVAEAAGLVLHRFDGGLELRVPGRDKGTAVATILAELGESAVVAYLGDDLTDEDAFAALAGRGLGVLVRPEPRPTAAALWLQPPDGLLTFLAAWRQASEAA